MNFRSDAKINHEKKLYQSFFLLKTTFKVAFQYLLNVVILFKKVLNLKLNFKLKTDQKTCCLKNLK